jgi:glycosyltransferase involved in cell wall biosynthesis
VIDFSLFAAVGAADTESMRVAPTTLRLLRALTSLARVACTPRLWWMWRRPPQGGVETLPVILCVFSRPGNLLATLLNLRAQRLDAHLEVHLHNNDADNALFLELVRRFAARWLGLRVVLHGDGTNLGPAARFRVARALRDARYVVTLDDDELFESSRELNILWSERRDASIVAMWAYKLTPGGTYLQRHAPAPGETAHYCGGGGQIADVRIFHDPRIVDVPEDFRYVDDLWLSYVAADRGWALKKSAARFRFFQEGRHGLYRTRAPASVKDVLVRKLRAQGWAA